MPDQTLKITVKTESKELQDLVNKLNTGNVSLKEYSKTMRELKGNATVGSQALKELKDVQSQVSAQTQTAQGKMMQSYFSTGEALRTFASKVMIVVAAYKALEKVFQLGQTEARMALLESTMKQMADKDGVNFAKVMGDITDKIGGSVSHNKILQGITDLQLLGIEWTEMPRIMEFAEMRSKMLGVSFDETFQMMERASMGNKKSIRSLKMDIDIEQSYKDFAKTIGVTSDQLNEAGKKHALFEAILKTGEEQHKNLDQALMSELEKYEQLETAWANLGAEAGKLATSLTPVVTVFTAIVGWLGTAVTRTREFASVAGDMFRLWLAQRGLYSFDKPYYASAPAHGGSSAKTDTKVVNPSQYIDQEKVDKKNKEDKEKRDKKALEIEQRRIDDQNYILDLSKEYNDVLDKEAEKQKELNKEREKQFNATAKGRWKKFTKDLQDEFETTNIVIGATNDAVSGLQNSMSTAVSGMLQGTMNIGQGFMAMKNMVIQALSEIIAKMMAMFILKQILGLFTGGASSVIPAVTSTGGSSIKGGANFSTGGSGSSDGTLRRMSVASQSSKGGGGMNVTTRQIETRIEGDKLVVVHQLAVQARKNRVG
jgi:hypothetical protein